MVRFTSCWRTNIFQIYSVRFLIPKQHSSFITHTSLSETLSHYRYYILQSEKLFFHILHEMCTIMKNVIKFVKLHGICFV